MQKLFITGAIASGKSTAARVLRELGAMVVDADGIVHELMSSGSSVAHTVGQHFGPSVMSTDGSVDRSALALIVFRDESALRELEKITHPAVVDEIKVRMNRAEENGAELFVAEVQLLVRSGLIDDDSHVLVIEASDSTRLQRLLGKGLDREQASNRMRMGPQPGDLRSIADTVITNDLDLAELTSRLEHFRSELI